MEGKRVDEEGEELEGRDEVTGGKGGGCTRHPACAIAGLPRSNGREPGRKRADCEEGETATLNIVRSRRESRS